MTAAPWPWRRWSLWQHDSDGHVPGIGRTDLDFYQPTSQLPTLSAAAAKPKPKVKKRRPRKLN